MLANFGATVALKKVGLPSNTFDFSNLSSPFDNGREPNKLRKRQPPSNDYVDDNKNNGWSSWMPSLTLPLTVSPWLAPKPASVPLGAVPNVGDPAPVDREGRLRLGRGQRTLIVFMRCVGCAFAQKAFLALRSIANRHADTMRCIAVSHASAHATRKWIDLMGGAWNVEIIIDESRALYTAWGLGLGNISYLFHPAAQVQAWKEKGWLGTEVADAVLRSQSYEVREVSSGFDDDDNDNTGVMGSKWQEAGAWAVDGKGTVIWGGKALRLDDGMSLEDGARILEL